MVTLVCRHVKREKLCWGRSHRSEIRLRRPQRICLHRSRTTTLQSGGCLLWTSSPSHLDPPTCSSLTLKQTICVACDMKLWQGWWTVARIFLCLYTKLFMALKMLLFVQFSILITSVSQCRRQTVDFLNRFLKTQAIFVEFIALVMEGKRKGGKKSTQKVHHRQTGKRDTWNYLHKQHVEQEHTRHALTFSHMSTPQHCIYVNSVNKSHSYAKTCLFFL